MVKKDTKFNYSKLEDRVFHNGTIHSTINITRKYKNKKMDVDDMRQIYEGMKKRLGPKAQFTIRGSNIRGTWTFKKFNDDELNIEDFEDYYRGKVRETDKFEKFHMISVTLLKFK